MCMLVVIVNKMFIHFIWQNNNIWSLFDLRKKERMKGSKKKINKTKTNSNPTMSAIYISSFFVKTFPVGLWGELSNKIFVFSEKAFSSSAGSKYHLFVLVLEEEVVTHQANQPKPKPKQSHLPHILSKRNILADPSSHLCLSTLEENKNKNKKQNNKKNHFRRVSDSLFLVGL